MAWAKSNIQRYIRQGKLIVSRPNLIEFNASELEYGNHNSCVEVHFGNHVRRWKTKDELAKQKSTKAIDWLIDSDDKRLAFEFKKRFTGRCQVEPETQTLAQQRSTSSSPQLLV